MVKVGPLRSPYLYFVRHNVKNKLFHELFTVLNLFSTNCIEPSLSVPEKIHEQETHLCKKGITVNWNLPRMSALVQRKFNRKVVIKKQLKSQLLRFLLLPCFLMYVLAHVIEVISAVPKETKKRAWH